jgi:hypothetical protein
MFGVLAAQGSFHGEARAEKGGWQSGWNLVYT